MTSRRVILFFLTLALGVFAGGCSSSPQQELADHYVGNFGKNSYVYVLQPDGRALRNARGQIVPLGVMDGRVVEGRWVPVRDQTILFIPDDEALLPRYVALQRIRFSWFAPTWNFCSESTRFLSYDGSLRVQELQERPSPVSSHIQDEGGR